MLNPKVASTLFVLGALPDKLLVTFTVCRLNLKTLLPFVLGVVGRD